MNSIILFGLLLLGPGGAEDYGIQIPSAVSPAGQLNYGTIAADDTHPSVKGKVVWTTSANTGATAITDLDDVVAHKWIILIGGSNTNPSTIADASPFNLDQSKGAMTLSLDAGIMLYAQADNDYIEISRWDDTALDDLAIATLTVNNTGLHILDTNASHDLIIVPGSDLTADRQLTFTTGDAARTVTLSGDLNVEASTNVNQDLTTDSTTAAFAACTLGNSGLHVLDTNASHDLIITPGSDLSADRILTITTGDAARTCTLSGDLTVESASLVNQDLTSDATPQFAGVQTGSATADTAAITMIKGAQVGDPQVQFALTADGVGGFSVTTSGGTGGDITLKPKTGKVKVTADGAANHGFYLDGITTHDTMVVRNAADGAAGDLTCGGFTATSGNFSDGNVTNVGDIAVDSVTADATSGGITLGGTGAATTESIKFQFGETGNIVDVTTATGVTDITVTGIDINTTTEVSAENLVSTDDADVNDTLTCGDLVVDEAAGTIAFTGATSATISTTSTDLKLVPSTGRVGINGSIVPSVSAAATDAAPTVMVITNQEPYAATPPATVPTNTTGANIIVLPSNGGRRLGSGAASGLCAADPCVFAAGQTITIPVQVSGTVTNCVLTADATEAAADRHFDCDGHTPAECGTSIVLAASTISPCSLITSTYANKTVSFARTATVSYLGAVVPSAAGITAQNGADGKINIPVGTVGSPTIFSTGDPDTGLYFDTTNSVALSAGGSQVMRAINAGSIYLQIAAAGIVNFLTRSRITSPVDGYVLTSNNAGTGGGAWVVYPQTITCATSGDGNHSTCGGAQTITSNMVQLVCEDTDGCTLTLAETNFSATVTGLVTLIGPAANHVDLADSAGVLELDGGAAFAMAALDTIDLVYAPVALAWVERNRHTDL